MSGNAQLALDFIAAWNENDVDKIMSFLADDCFYHNIPMEPMQGADAIRGFISGFSAMARADARLTAVVVLATPPFWLTIARILAN